MWKLSDIDRNKSYRLLLVQSNTGGRRFVLQDMAELSVADGLFSFTEVVPHELLAKRNLRSISKSVALANGENFHVDAHGVWITQDEMTAILDDREDHEIPWLNSLPPQLAPK